MMHKLVKLKYRDEASIMEHLNNILSLVNQLVTMQIVQNEEL